jgi:hypothetical protein
MATKIKLLFWALLGLSLVPALASASLALGSTDAGASAKVNLGVNFCTNLPALNSTINTRLTNA